jgi:hypothetical protein
MHGCQKKENMSSAPAVAYAAAAGAGLGDGDMEMHVGVRASGNCSSKQRMQHLPTGFKPGDSRKLVMWRRAGVGAGC